MTSGRWGEAEWREEFYFYSQPQVGKLLIGAAQAAVGSAGEAPVYDYDWQRLPSENAAAGRVPEAAALLAGRTVGAALGWAGCVTLWWLAVLLGAPRAGPLAAVLLASQPLWLANARRAGLDVPALTLGLLAAAMAVEGARRGRQRWWLAAGALGGLAVGTKYVALLALAAAIPFVVQRAWSERQWRGAAGPLLAAVLGVAVFAGTNPALWHDPLLGVNVSLGFLSGQAEGMRHTMPEFGAPPWVALQMVDRVFWPLGGPKVVEQSLPEPLRPGTYGTPVIALGVLVALALARRGERGLGAAAAWGALVFCALAISLPTWWERWHVPLVPPLALLAALGLASLPRGGASLGWLLAGAQYVAALSLLPSYLGKGFGQLVMSPVGAVAHLGALAWTLATLVSLALPQLRAGREAKQDGGAETGGTTDAASRDHRDGRDRGGAHHGLSEDRRGGAVRRV
ncbi:MAG TPA: glycosyltransferase family 39 protein [Chloroflexota bacterium]|nr:glycosyltransferase family 39 protein [Chloroflexota bacterium]